MRFTIKTVDALPAIGSRSAYTMYIVRDGSRADLYFTGSVADTVYTGISYNEMYTAFMNDVNTAIGNAVTSATELKVVADLTAMTTYSTASGASKPLMALVIDPRAGDANINAVDVAGGDTTVASGSATYIWDHVGETWYKIAEQESMDLVLSWANLQDKPTSTVAQIDQAVADSHTHSNKAVLDLLTEDVDGALNYDGVPLVTYEDLWS